MCWVTAEMKAVASKASTIPQESGIGRPQVARRDEPTDGRGQIPLVLAVAHLGSVDHRAGLRHVVKSRLEVPACLSPACQLKNEQRSLT